MHKADGKTGYDKLLFLYLFRSSLFLLPSLSFCLSRIVLAPCINIHRHKHPCLTLFLCLPHLPLLSLHTSITPLFPFVNYCAFCFATDISAKYLPTQLFVLTFKIHISLSRFPFLRWIFLLLFLSQPLLYITHTPLYKVCFTRRFKKTPIFFARSLP
jgi:hypothetical protein